MRRALLLAGLTLAAAGALPAQQVTARVGGALTGVQYTHVTVPIAVDMTAAGGATLGSYTARLTWDPNALYLYSTTPLQGNFPQPLVNVDSVAEGILKFSAVAPSGVGGLVTVARYDFGVLTGIATPSPIDLTFSEMSAAGTFQDLMPSLTVQSGTFCLARGLWGDLDGDHAANSRDALFVLTAVVGLPTPGADTSLADVSGDNTTSSLDALVILSYAVGIPVTGQRVLLPAPGSCGGASASQVAVQPGTIDLTVGQPFQFAVQATDATGHAVAVPTMSWLSSDYSIAAVDVTGLVSARTVGTATITAVVSPGVRASATVNVIPRRPNWYVDIAATGHVVQNGSAAYPYENPLAVFPLVSEGDTIRVATGSYYWTNTNGGQLDRGVVLLGGTPGDTTTRPAFRVDAANGYVPGLWLTGGQRTEVQNIAFFNLDPGIEIAGVRNLVVQDAKFVNQTANGYGDGITQDFCAIPMDTLRIDRSVFQGDPQYRYGSGVYISGCYNAPITVGTMSVQDSRFLELEDGVQSYGVDSLAVLRSDFVHNDGYGLYISLEADPALYVAHSLFDRNYSTQIAGYDLRRAVLDSNVIHSDSAQAVQLYGLPSPARARSYLHGDSIDMGVSDPWLTVSSHDSLVVQDVVMRSPASPATSIYSTIDADVASFRRVHFTNVGGTYYYGYGVIDFTGRRLEVDSVTMSTCTVAGCDQGYGVIATPGSGVQLTTSIQRSNFSGIQYPVHVSGGGSHEVRNVVIDSANTGIYAYGVDSVAVVGNVMTRIYNRGLDLQYPTGALGPSLVTGNAITCVSGGQNLPSGAFIYGAAALIDQDTVAGCSKGLELNSVVASGMRVQRNTLRGNGLGVYLYQYNDSTIVPIDSNGISGSPGAAVTVDFGRVSLTHNRIENDSNGVVINDYLGYVSQLHDNAFVNNLYWALNVPYDSADASGNWWDPPGPLGGPPSTTQPNGVNGRANTTGYLAAPPANLPGLAPPAPFSVAAWSPALTAAPTRASAARAIAPPSVTRTTRPAPVYASATQPGRTAARAAQIEAQRRLRAAQDVARDHRVADDERVREERRASRQQH